MKMKMKMKYTEQAVETLDDAGSVIANKNIEIEQLRQRVHELEKEPSVESGGEFKTWWEIALHVGAWKNHELDYVHFGSEMAVRAFAIHLLKQRDKEESQLIQTIANLTAERDALKQLYESSEESVLALKETRNRLAEERDALKQQRDELLAALEQFATWGRMQHKAQSKGCHATFDMMSLKDEIDLAEAAIASAKEKQNEN